MKNIFCFILVFILSTEMGLAQFSATQQQQIDEDNQRSHNLLVGGIVGMAVIATAGIIAVVTFHSKARKKADADEAKFQACVGKTKNNIYTIYGPPNSIVDDAQGQGGTILEYISIVTSGGGKFGVYTTTYRKMFYLNKDNIVTSVKEDTQ